MASLDSSIRDWSARQWRACQRSHLPGYDPYANSGGYRFDVPSANDAIGFIECLQFIEGEKAGQSFVLEGWQRAIIGALFGWRNKYTGLRRYREAFVFVARKNGKTPLAAAIVLLGLFCDNEPGAQIYSAAAEREQAALVYRHAAGMIAREPQLASRCKAYRTFRSIEVGASNSIYKALSADADTKHGFSSHMVIVDELHAHPNGELVDVLQTSMGARREPLMIHITTADYDRPSVCNRKYDYAVNVRDGVFDDQSFLPVIYEAGDGDDWRIASTWKKANPNLGVSVRRDYLERECMRAQNEPSYENTFKRLHLNIRTRQDVRWIPMDRWDKCGADPVPEGPCYAGLDLASTTDIAALVLFWPSTGALVPWFWIPDDRAEQRERRDHVPYIEWSNRGLLETTPGNVIDYSYIREKINSVAGEYDLRLIGYDPWNARHLAQQLQDDDGLPLTEFRQGFISMNEPSKYFERLIMCDGLCHGGHDVLRWMAGNVTVKTDPSGNIKPDKAKSTEKIDGIVASIMAVGLAMVADSEQTDIPNVAAIW